jgi:hypothetical protein
MPALRVLSDDERSLYDDVTQYLPEPSIYAFLSAAPLLLIGFHRAWRHRFPRPRASANVARIFGDSNPVSPSMAIENQSIWKRRTRRG